MVQFELLTMLTPLSLLRGLLILVLDGTAGSRGFEFRPALSFSKLDETRRFNLFLSFFDAVLFLSVFLYEGFDNPLHPNVMKNLISTKGLYLDLLMFAVG